MKSDNLAQLHIDSRKEKIQFKLKYLLGFPLLFHQCSSLSVQPFLYYLCFPQVLWFRPAFKTQARQVYWSLKSVHGFLCISSDVCDLSRVFPCLPLTRCCESTQCTQNLNRASGLKTVNVLGRTEQKDF